MENLDVGCSYLGVSRTCPPKSKGNDVESKSIDRRAAGRFARTMIVALGVVPLAAGAVLLAPTAQARPADPVVTLTAAQLREAGFPKNPNVVGWGPDGSAELPTHKAASMEQVVITGKAPKGTKAGQELVMERFLPTDKQGSGDFEVLDITTTVRPDRTFTLLFSVGRVGRYGYRVGYMTDSASPEFRGFQFQFRTTPS